MKKILLLLLLLLPGFCAGTQEIRCTFTQNKTIKALNKMIPEKGTVRFKAPDQFEMRYSVPEGEYLIIKGNEVRRCIKGKVLKFDTTKNSMVRKKRNILLYCITGEYEKAAKENEATLIVENKGNVKCVAMKARKKSASGYPRILVDYNAQGLPVRMVLDELTGTSSEYFFTY